MSPSLFVGPLLLFVLAHFAHHLLTSLPVPLLPMIRSDFALDYTQSGLVISAFSLSYGFGQLPGGWLADRMGSRLVLTTSIAGTALAGFLVGVSPAFWMMILSLGLMGILGGGYHPAAPVVISASVDLKNQGRALGLHLVGGGSSFFLSPLIATAIAVSYGWRVSFIFMAILGLVFGIFFYVTFRRQEGRGQWGRGKKWRDPHLSSPARNLRPLVFFIILSNVTQAVMFSAISFIPLFLVDRLGFSKGMAGAFLAWVYSAGLWVGPWAGYLSDRVGRIPVVLAVCLLVGPVIYSLNLVTSPWGMSVLLLTLGVLGQVRMPVCEAYIIRNSPEDKRSLILGLYYFGSIEAGGVLTPVVGYLIDHLGFETSYTIAAVTILAATLICWPFLKGSPD